ncbi:hypothetical protein BDV24DRAFT_170565 [Aspergillus arachidicola]|uniref:Uncharacterized protein n=1 Tax=Aspergillus arachidicola TaxID=656916 RepID=A0A5N6XLF8_9EURO|nr:hypothetical protein BDV24DRAFT_170565 [Aspergillus arachidicola]
MNQDYVQSPTNGLDSLNLNEQVPAGETYPTAWSFTTKGEVSLALATHLSASNSAASSTSITASFEVPMPTTAASTAVSLSPTSFATDRGTSTCSISRNGAASITTFGTPIVSLAKTSDVSATQSSTANSSATTSSRAPSAPLFTSSAGRIAISFGASAAGIIAFLNI